MILLTRALEALASPASCTSPAEKRGGMTRANGETEIQCFLGDCGVPVSAISAMTIITSIN